MEIFFGVLAVRLAAALARVPLRVFFAGVVASRWALCSMVSETAISSSR